MAILVVLDPMEAGLVVRAMEVVVVVEGMVVEEGKATGDMVVAQVMVGGLNQVAQVAVMKEQVVLAHMAEVIVAVVDTIHMQDRLEPFRSFLVDAISLDSRVGAILEETRVISCSGHIRKDLLRTGRASKKFLLPYYRHLLVCVCLFDLSFAF